MREHAPRHAMSIITSWKMLRLKPIRPFHRACQNLAMTSILSRTMPKPSTIEGHRIHGEFRGLLECAAVQQVEISDSWIQEPASEQRAGPSCQERETLVHPEPTKEKRSRSPGPPPRQPRRTVVFTTASAGGYTTTIDDMPIKF
jgi:hypothetical protein